MKAQDLVLLRLRDKPDDRTYQVDAADRQIGKKSGDTVVEAKRFGLSRQSSIRRTHLCSSCSNLGLANASRAILLDAPTSDKR